MARVWDYPSGKAVATSVPFNVGQSAGGRADGAVLAIPDAIGVNVLDVVSGQTVKELRVFAQPEEISALAYAGDTFLVLRPDSVERWDPASGLLLKRYDAKGEGLVVSPDGRWFALRDKYIKVYDMETGQQRHSLGPNLGDYVFTPDSNFLVTASGQMAAFWDLRTAQTGTWARALASHGPTVGGLAFTPDGTRLVSSTGDMWDVASGKLLTKFKSQASQIAISPEGTLLVGNDGSLWNADNGQLMGQLSGMDGSALRLAFTPDGRRLLWETQDRVVEVWEIAP
jgi:WD40 repeat protein